MCWTDQILYVGNRHGDRDVREPCGHIITQSSHRCLRARLQIRSRLFGWFSSRYEWHGGKAFCVKREKVIHRVYGLCSNCRESQSAPWGHLRWPTMAGRPQPYYNTYHHWTLQNKGRNPADRDPQTCGEQILRQADKMQHIRSGADISECGDKSIEEIRAAVPAPPPFYSVSQTATECCSASALPSQNPSRMRTPRRLVAPPRLPRPVSDDTGFVLALDPSLVPSPLMVVKDRAKSSTQRSWPMPSGDSSSSRRLSSAAATAPALTIEDLENYVNGEFVSLVSGFGVVRPRQW